MASENGRADTPLVRTLYDEAYRFEFFQAVRLLERVQPGRDPVGRGGDPAREIVRFRTRVSLDFPASEIHELGWASSPASYPAPVAPAAGAAATALAPAEDERPEMTVSFMGLTGPLGVLPHAYTELLIDRTRHRDTALWEFLDLFNHRMISLFYRAWEKYRFPVAYERGEEDRFTGHLFGAVGFGTRGLRGRSAFEDQALIFYGGLVAQQPHASVALEGVLRDYFGVEARVEQCVGQWLALDEEGLTRLGAANSRLGVDAVAGSRVWDAQAKFRVRFGPLAFDEFRDFLPVGSAFRPAAELARLLAGQEFDFDVQLTLRADEVPDCELAAEPGRRPMLGWTSWLKTRPFTRDDSQVVLGVPV